MGFTISLELWTILTAVAAIVAAVACLFAALNDHWQGRGRYFAEIRAILREIAGVSV